MSANASETTAVNNPLGMLGFDFVEFTSPDAAWLDTLFRAFGFSRTMQSSCGRMDLHHQNDIRMVVNRRDDDESAQFRAAHGPAISAMGWRVQDPQHAHDEAVRRGATSAMGRTRAFEMPAILGIGDSLIYFVGPQDAGGGLFERTMVAHPEPFHQPDAGFVRIDHLTNNVYKGTMHQWADFYKDVFGFTEVRYFDIRGEKTGLTSYALRSPDGSFCIPINEGSESTSQIDEYLREYQGPGVQHLAFLTVDLLSSLDRMEGGPIQTLDIDDAYYGEVFDRVPGVREDPARIQHHNVLVDGDDEGYLLQIFTKNVVGPIFIELIQRENHHSFGEGNFGALFRSIERDQERRGVL